MPFYHKSTTHFLEESVRFFGKTITEDTPFPVLTIHLEFFIFWKFLEANSKKSWYGLLLTNIYKFIFVTDEGVNAVFNSKWEIGISFWEQKNAN